MLFNHTTSCCVLSGQLMPSGLSWRFCTPITSNMRAKFDPGPNQVALRDMELPVMGPIGSRNTTKLAHSGSGYVTQFLYFHLQCPIRHTFSASHITVTSNFDLPKELRLIIFRYVLASPSCLITLASSTFTSLWTDHDATKSSLRSWISTKSSLYPFYEPARCFTRIARTSCGGKYSLSRLTLRPWSGRDHLCTSSQICHSINLIQFEIGFFDCHGTKQA
jgi:hypothetical protein